MKKRLLACALALVMALGMLSGSVLAADYRFSDVSASDWYYDAVRFVADSGLMDGTGNGFEPVRTTSRAMLWTVLARVDGQNAKRSTAPDWYAAAQLWAMRKEISDGSDPNGTLTREQLAAMLYRYAQCKGLVLVPPCAELETFSDAADVSAYAREAMQWAVETGVISGMDGRLSPKSSATRAQVAQILYRLCRTWNLPAQDDASMLLTALLPAALLPQHEHSWEDPTANGNGMHTFRCDCGETKAEFCSFEKKGDRWICSVCGFEIPDGEAIESWEELKKAIKEQKPEMFLVADIAVEETLSIAADTTIYGCNHKLTLAEGFSSKMFDAKSKHLTLHGMTLDGEYNTINGGPAYHGVINGEEGSKLTLEHVTFENFKAQRIIRAQNSEKVTLTDVTFRKNKIQKTADTQPRFVLFVNGVPETELKNVSIVDNESTMGLIGVYYGSATKGFTAENLLIENNTLTGSNHIIASMGLDNTSSIHLISGAIRNNTNEQPNIFVSTNLAVGEDMLVEGDIVLNNDGNKGVCTLTNNGTIIGDISSADWAVLARGCPKYTGTGTHDGTLTGFTME